MALETNLIDAADFCGISIGYHEWRHVLNNFRASPNDGIAPDSAELMNSGESPNDRMILHCHVTGDSAIVRENNVIANYAIMGDMRISKKVAVRADDSLCARKCTSVDGAKFTKGIMIADFEIGRLNCVFQILGPMDEWG